METRQFYRKISNPRWWLVSLLDSKFDLNFSTLTALQPHVLKFKELESFSRMLHLLNSIEVGCEKDRTEHFVYYTLQKSQTFS
jgi:hypothetical protein